MSIIKLIDHTPEDVLLWMTAPSPAGPFDSTKRLWEHCIAVLEEAGLVERTGEREQDVEVTRAGEAHARDLRAEPKEN